MDTRASANLASVTATYSLTYLTDEAARPYAAFYRGSDVTTTFHLVTNDRGDVLELTDSDGAAFAAYRYDAWGNPQGVFSQATSRIPAALAEAIAARQPLRYAGYCFDAPTGLYYLSQRYYDPSTYQFISKDPAKADGEESAYQYCGGDPVGKVGVACSPMVCSSREIQSSVQWCLGLLSELQSA